MNQKLIFMLSACLNAACVFLFISVYSASESRLKSVHSIRRTLHRNVVMSRVAKKLPTIYVVTPTYKRPEQIADLTRLAQTLLLVPDIHWIVADDSRYENKGVTNYLNYTTIPHTYLLAPMPMQYKRRGLIRRPRGVSNRMAGMKWILDRATDGVMYFADDDNTYDVRLFKEMRWTKRVSIWPVGLVSSTGVSSPILLANGTFAGWFDGWSKTRVFAVDMASFAVSVAYLRQVKASMPYQAGSEEDGFLRSLKIQPKDLEFKADNCTKIYVWHTRTVKNRPASRSIFDKKYDNTNLAYLGKFLQSR